MNKHHKECSCRLNYPWSSKRAKISKRCWVILNTALLRANHNLRIYSSNLTWQIRITCVILCLKRRCKRKQNHSAEKWLILRLADAMSKLRRVKCASSLTFLTTKYNSSIKQEINFLNKWNWARKLNLKLKKRRKKLKTNARKSRTNLKSWKCKFWQFKDRTKTLIRNLLSKIIRAKR